MNDGFDIGIKRQSQDNDNDIIDDDEIDPGNCVALGLSTTYEKVLDFTYDRGNKEEINLNEDIGLVNSCLEICSRRGLFTFHLLFVYILVLVIYTYFRSNLGVCLHFCWKILAPLLHIY